MGFVGKKLNIFHCFFVYLWPYSSISVKKHGFVYIKSHVIPVLGCDSFPVFLASPYCRGRI